MNSTRFKIKIFSLNPKCPSKMFIIYGKRLKPSPEVMHIFPRHLWSLKLIQTYLNWSYLNAIYILGAPKMLEIVMGHWNNSDSTPNYFQDFIKWFSILLNQNKTN